MKKYEVEVKLRFEGTGNLDIKERVETEERGPVNWKYMANVT